MKVPLTINDFLDRGATVYPDRVAIVDEPDQPAAPMPEITYRELADIKRQMGVAMDKLGIPMGARVAMVSGASSGVGRALALELAGRGWDVAIGARRIEALEGVAKAVEQRGACYAAALSGV